MCQLPKQLSEAWQTTPALKVMRLMEIQAEPALIAECGLAQNHCVAVCLNLKV